MKFLKSIIKILVVLFLIQPILLAEDIRDLYVGAKIINITERGYTNFKCLSSEKGIKSWKGFSQCQKGKNNLHSVKFEYDERFALNENFEGTQVSGHPVLINIAIDKEGILQEINIKTDPKAPFYFRKQAHLMWLRIYNKYGSDDWKCDEILQSKNHIKVGKKYVNKTCIKMIKNKAIKLHSEFYFLNDKTKKENLVSRTSLQIKSNNNL
jgi:hypothetical protein